MPNWNIRILGVLIVMSVREGGASVTLFQIFWLNIEWAGKKTPVVQRS